MRQRWFCERCDHYCDVAGDLRWAKGTSTKQEMRFDVWCGDCDEQQPDVMIKMELKDE